MTATTTIHVSDECVHKECSNQTTVVYIVTGDFGKDGVVAYCDYHVEEYADPLENHTALSEVDHD